MTSHIVQVSPPQFYQMVDIASKFWKNEIFQKTLSEVEPALESVLKDMTAKNEILLKAAAELKYEERFSVKKKKDESSSEFSNENSEPKHVRTNIILVMLEITQEVKNSIHAVLQVIQDLRPGYLTVSDDRKQLLKKFEDMQQFTFETQINMPVLSRLYSALNQATILDQYLARTTESIASSMERYFQFLHHRHTVEGVEIVRNPILTDIALGIYSNIDANGEIQDGKSASEVSQFTMTKAKILVETITNQDIYMLIVENKMTEIVISTLKTLAEFVVQLGRDSEETLTQLNTATGKKTDWSKSISSSAARSNISNNLNKFHSMNPNSIRHKESVVLLSKEDKWVASFRATTLNQLVGMLKFDAPEPEQVIKYVLERKEQLRKFFQDENSFYVCKISAGNPFGGEAPGALKVIPGQRPNSTIESIVGTGFPEVRDFVKSIEAAAKWHDLFVATSPSKSADKSNILLVGPQGCGKTEVMRAVASDKNSIGIFAQGSDFQTCWKGEAEKNPKRLFEAGLKIQKDSKKHVHFLIDEIDSILNNDKSFSMDSNLTLEFQILMDGVVSYPNLSVWGATNNPQRIPMPMIRRFSKVLIVGELNVEHRVQLLQQFVNFMPIRDWNDQAWIDMANKLEGATGDVIRKVVDHIWREKMTRFTINNTSAAAQLLGELRSSGPFQIADFNKEARRMFKEKLKHHVSISPEDVKKSIDLHLNNIAIRNEIATAVKTYRDAHDFLSNLSKEEI